MNYVENLDELLELCEKLYSQLAHIEKNNEFEDEKNDIRQSLRKLIIAEAIQKKHIICVTGLQGVGKTSLMQNYYGIDFSKMNISEARGEKLPIMISEKKDSQEVTFYSVEIKKDGNNPYKRIRTPVNSEDFCERTKNISENSDVMYLEMEVPYKYIKNESCSFLLLPGFEKRLNYWQELIQFALNTSDVALFVTDYSSYVENDNQQLMEKIKEQFNSHSMICAITHSDQTENQNRAIKKDIEESFNLKEDQVILTGFYPNENEKHENWCMELTNAIQKYNSSGNEKAIFEMISDVKNQVKSSIKNIEDKLESEKIEIDLEKFGIEDELKNFDSQIKTIRKDWSKRLKGLLKNAESKSIEFVTEKEANENNEDRVRNWFNKAGKRIFGENAKDIKEQRDLLISSLKENEVPLSTLAIANSFFDDGNTSNYISEYLLEEKTKNGVFSVNKNKKAALMNNIALLLRGKDAIDEKGKPLTEFNNDVSQTYEMLAEIAVYNYAKRYGKNILDSCPEIVQSLKSSMPDDLLEKMTDSKKLGIGIFAMAGIDFLPDSKFDALTSLADALSIPNGAMVGIFSGIMAVASGVTLTRDINTMARKQLMVYEEAIRTYYQNVYDTALDDFDDAMRRLRDLVAKNLASIQGVDSNHFTLINARSCIAQLKDRINELYQDMRLESKETKIAGLLTD